MRPHLLLLLWVVSSAGLSSGCGFDARAAQLEFGLQPSTRATLAGSPELLAQLEQGLAQRFGTPAEPRDPSADPSRGPSDARISLAQSAERYRVECLHCHGVDGGGDGPTAAHIDPRPRDFRRGIFKWSSVGEQSRPTHEDLVRVIERGVWGTMMPALARLDPAERQGLADYVRYLAVRGEVETQVALAVEETGELDDAAWDEALELVAGKWAKAPSRVVVFDGAVPEASAASIARGRELYENPAKGNCAACHGSSGRGDGPVAFKLDERGRRVPAYQDAWGFDILPRNLRRDPFRGGRRSIDLYRRIHAGIQGGPMPAMSTIMTPAEIWDVVHYTQSLAEDVHPAEYAASEER